MIDPADEEAVHAAPVARLIALGAVVFSTALPCLRFEQLGTLEVEPVIALGALVAVFCFSGGNRAVFGFRLTPSRGWRYWARMAGVFAGIILLLAALIAGAFSVLGWRIPIPRRDPQFIYAHTFLMCVYAPIVEEMVFRALLTFAVLPTLGPRWTIIVSGFVFAILHILRGIPGADNLVAGFMLQWAFLRSGTILVPMAFHAGGNLMVLAGHVASWHLLGPIQ